MTPPEQNDGPSWWDGRAPRKTSRRLRVSDWRGVEAILPLGEGTWDVHVSDSRDCVILFARRHVEGVSG